MKIVAISSNKDICIGLKLVGVECYNAKNAEELSEVLAKIPASDIGMLVVSDDLSITAPLVRYLDANPQILFLAVNGNEEYME